MEGDAQHGAVGARGDSPLLPPGLPLLLTPSTEAQVGGGQTPTWPCCSFLVTWLICHHTPGWHCHLPPHPVVMGSWGAAGG